MQEMVKELQPRVVVVDPVTNLMTSSNQFEVKSMMVRLIDFLKMEHITALFTSLTGSDASEASTDVGISSLMDAWLLVRYLESNGERNRGLYILKSRGMNHSNQVREFCLTDHGVELMDVYLGPEGILAGSARVTHEAQARIDAENRELEMARKKHELDLKQKGFSNQIAALQANIAATQEELNQILHMEALRKEMTSKIQAEIAISRRADEPGDGDNKQPAGKKTKSSRHAGDTEK
jgi:circadian clock protein KaiC